MTEADSINAVIGGDMEAFRTVFERYYPKVLAFLRSFLQSADDAEDVAQDVFVKLWMKRELLSGVEHLDFYLFRMTVNAAVNWSKVRKRYTGIDGVDVRSGENVETRFDSRERLSAISRIVSEMPDKRREVFVMSRLHGMSHKEIAARLEISVKTVENHINLALRELRKVKCILAFFCAMMFS